MIVVIKLENGKWTWKERDEKGNSVRVGNERFNSELEAARFVDAFPKEKDLKEAPAKKSIDDTIADGIAPLRQVARPNDKLSEE